MKSKHKVPKTLYEKGPIVVERLPSGKLDAYETYKIADDTHARPQWMVCDCCLRQSDRLWMWRHYGFCTLQYDGVPRHDYYAGRWGFCVYCRPLFEKREISILTARVCTLNPELYARAIAALYSILPYVIYGEPALWESGQPRLRSE